MTRSICSVAVAALAVAGFAHAEDQKPLSNGIASDYTCQHPPYQIQMLSKSPLVIYIEDFITPDERAHLQSLASVPYLFSKLAMHKACNANYR